MLRLELVGDGKFLSWVHEEWEGKGTERHGTRFRSEVIKIEFLHLLKRGDCIGKFSQTYVLKIAVKYTKTGYTIWKPAKLPAVGKKLNLNPPGEKELRMFFAHASKIYVHAYEYQTSGL